MRTAEMLVVNLTLALVALLLGLVPGSFAQNQCVDNGGHCVSGQSAFCYNGPLDQFDSACGADGALCCAGQVPPQEQESQGEENSESNNANACLAHGGLCVPARLGATCAGAPMEELDAACADGHVCCTGQTCGAATECPHDVCTQAAAGADPANEAQCVCYARPARNCDDGNLLTRDMAVPDEKAGVCRCVHEPRIECDDGDACTEDRAVLDPETMQPACEHEPIPHCATSEAGEEKGKADGEGEQESGEPQETQEAQEAQDNEEVQVGGQGGEVAVTNSTLTPEQEAVLTNPGFWVFIGVTLVLLIVTAVLLCLLCMPGNSVRTPSTAAMAARVGRSYMPV